MQDSKESRNDLALKLIVVAALVLSLIILTSIAAEAATIGQSLQNVGTSAKGMVTGVTSTANGVFSHLQLFAAGYLIMFALVNLLLSLGGMQDILGGKVGVVKLIAPLVLLFMFRNLTEQLIAGQAAGLTVFAIAYVAIYGMLNWEKLKEGTTGDLLAAVWPLPIAFVLANAKTTDIQGLFLFSIGALVVTVVGLALARNYLFKGGRQKHLEKVNKSSAENIIKKMEGKSEQEIRKAMRDAKIPREIAEESLSEHSQEITEAAEKQTEYAGDETEKHETKLSGVQSDVDYMMAHPEKTDELAKKDEGILTDIYNQDMKKPNINALTAGSGDPAMALAQYNELALGQMNRVATNPQYFGQQTTVGTVGLEILMLWKHLTPEKGKADWNRKQQDEYWETIRNQKPPLNSWMELLERAEGSDEIKALIAELKKDGDKMNYLDGVNFLHKCMLEITGIRKEAEKIFKQYGIKLHAADIELEKMSKDVNDLNGEIAAKEKAIDPYRQQVGIYITETRQALNQLRELTKAGHREESLKLMKSIEARIKWMSDFKKGERAHWETIEQLMKSKSKLLEIINKRIEKIRRETREMTSGAKNVFGGSIEEEWKELMGKDEKVPAGKLPTAPESIAEFPPTGTG